MSIVLSGLIGAFLATITSYIYNIWKYQRDERGARIDEICIFITKNAEVSSNYWAKQYETKIQQQIDESKIVASQNIVDGLYADVRCFFNSKSAELIDYRLSELMDAITGGDFSVEGRQVDIDRVAISQYSAANAIIQIRKEYRETIPLLSLFRGYNNNQNRKLDMPQGFNQ